MSAFARTRELQKVEKLLQIGKDEVYGEAMTLQHPRLMELLDRIDAAMLDAHTSSATSTPEALKMAAEHAHTVYHCCAQRTPLAQHRWEKWSRMLSVCLTHARDMASDDVCQHIASLAAQLHAYRRKEWWGSAAEVRRELHLLQQELQNDDEACTGTTHDVPPPTTATTHATATTTTPSTSSQPRWRSAEDVAAAHAPLLHRFSRLCFDGRHLFGVYGDVGRIQRESFLEGVLMRGGLQHTTEEAAVEALQRQTFKRDVVVPCDAVAETMWLEYEDFEVDESKKKEMEHLRTCTMKSACYTAMKNFFEYESSHDGVDAGGVAVLDDARGEALADACAAAMRSSRDVGPLPTFAFGMRRVLELERFPAVLNPSRVEYFVGLLHGWAKSYATSQHRWSWQSPFSAETDEDVWCFVLERHEVLLRWALLRPTSSPTPGTPEALEMLRGQILMLRFMAHAVLHMYAHYVAIVNSSKASAEKKRQRLMCVQAATQVWVEEVLGKCFAKCLLSDVYALASSPDDDDDDVSVFALEADLKLILCDVDALLHGSSLAPTIIRHRLLPLTQDSVEMMESLASRTTTPVVATLDACALTNLRLMSWLRRTLSSSASLRTTLSTCADEAGFVGQLVALHRRCFYVVARHGLPASTVDAARDAWMACVQMAQVEVEMGSTCSQRIFCMSVAGNDVLDVVMEERRSRKRARG